MHDDNIPWDMETTNLIFFLIWIKQNKMEKFCPKNILQFLLGPVYTP